MIVCIKNSTNTLLPSLSNPSQRVLIANPLKLLVDVLAVVSVFYNYKWKRNIDLVVLWKATNKTYEQFVLLFSPIMALYQLREILLLESGPVLSKHIL